MGKVAKFLGITFFIFSSANSQAGQKFFGAADASIATAVAASDFATLNTLTAGKCDAVLSDATSQNKTISERLKASEEAIACVEEGKSLLFSMAKDSDRLKIKDLLQPLSDQAYKANQVANAEAEFMGLAFGVGFGYSLGFSKAIDNAVIVNGVVRVTSEKKEQPRAILEFHKYFWCNKGNKDGTQGCGPFVAVSATQEKALSGVGMGFMYGRKSKATDSEGFSVGLGVILDAKVKDLADGFNENEAPPTGETTVRFNEKARWAGLLFVTRSF